MELDIKKYEAILQAKMTNMIIFWSAFILALIIITLLFRYWIGPNKLELADISSYVLDIKNKSYYVYEGYYTRSEKFDNKYVYIDDSRIRLVTGMSYSELPAGTNEGYVVYSQRTKRIVDWIPKQ